jgi:predicted RNA-binding protein with PUA-like domain
MLWWLHVNNAIIYAGGVAAGLNPWRKILLMPFGFPVEKLPAFPCGALLFLAPGLNNQILPFIDMAYWLVKSEPFKYSWDQFVKDKQTFWDGVRNYAARNNLRAMKKGDEVLFYHSNEGLEVVGIAKVAKEHYSDPTATEGDWSVVDLKPVKAIKKPVSLATIKADKRLANMQILKLGRLSVTAVTPEEWGIIMELGGMR